MRLVGISALCLLFIAEVIVCAEYVGGGFDTIRKIFLAAIVGSCLVIDGACVIEVFTKQKKPVVITLYSVAFVFLTAISLMSTSVYVVAMFCIVLTLAYARLAAFRDELFLFLACSAVYAISYAIGWVIVNAWNGLDFIVASAVGDILFGVTILTVHFLIANFLFKFYRLNERLVLALNEADESKARLKEVYEQLSRSAVYEERNRIAGDIHDNAGHSMTTVIMQTEAAKKLFDTQPEEAKKAIISANIQAKNALEQMRESVHLLAGREGESSLKTVIEQIVAQTIDGTELKIRCDLQDFQASDALLRIITASLKEALANGVRHGGATAFYIETRLEENSLSLLVSDNGCGLKNGFKEGFGLGRMREKAEAFGGSLTLTGDDGEGCELLLILPLEGNDLDIVKGGLYD